MAGTWIFLPPSDGGSLYFGDPVAAVVNLPVSGTTGEIRVVVSTATIYMWNGSAWVPTAGGSGITALTGDVTATGPGSAAATLATVNGAPGSFGSETQVAAYTVNAKGLVTAGSNVAIQLASSAAVTGLGAQLAAKAPLASPTFTGTVTLNGGAVQLAVLTTVQRDALTPANGMLIFNSDTSRFQGYFSAAWSDIHGWGS